MPAAKIEELGQPVLVRGAFPLTWFLDAASVVDRMVRTTADRLAEIVRTRLEAWRAT
jgi:hypothetical protein